MSDKGFEFSGFLAPPVEREFFPRDGMKEGEGIILELNLDHLTIERMDAIDRQFNESFDETVGIFKEIAEAVEEKPAPKAGRGSKKLAVAGKKPEPKPEIPKFEMFAFEKAKMRFWARVLAGEPGNTDPTQRMIHGWSVVKDGKSVPVSYETFVQIPQNGLSRLYKFVMGEANNPTPSEKKESASTSSDQTSA